MSDVELVKKMLRAVLQSSKHGVAISRLQRDYSELTGEMIPFRKFGHATLESFLRSISSVVRLQSSGGGEVMCFAGVCEETAHIAQLVARQKTVKKSGCSKLVNLQMRAKSYSVFSRDAKPHSSLRQPGLMIYPYRSSGNRSSFNPPLLPLFNSRHTRVCNAPRMCPAPETASTRPKHSQAYSHPYKNSITQAQRKPANVELVQSRVQQLLKKYSSGVWLSKISQLYRDMFQEEFNLHKELESWKNICTVEKPNINSMVDRLVFPALKQSPPNCLSPSSLKQPTSAQKSTHIGRSLAITIPSVPPKAQIPVSPTSPNFATSNLNICKTPKYPTYSLITPPTTPPSDQPLNSEVKQKLQQLLNKYSRGLWADTLPQLFKEAFGCVFPQTALEDFSLLADTCMVEYPMPDNRKKAILYKLPSQVEKQPCPPRPLLLPCSEMPQLPPLIIPPEDFLSVLVMESISTNRVVLRFVGKAYSTALEELEENMLQFYSALRAESHLPSPKCGQLVAVSIEEDAVLRAQVHQVMGNSVKVYCVDHGFSEVVDLQKVFLLQEQFLILPIQAILCQLAGLEQFSTDAVVEKTLQSIAVGRTLLAEVVEREDSPLIVLYDTSQNEDINVNAVCLKSLHDKSMENPLKVNSVYTHMCVTNVCSDGSIFCQLPSRGQDKLRNILEKIEAHFISQLSWELLVGKPYCGKVCLAKYKGKWARAEIANLHGNQVLDVVFLDLGLPASMEVSELRDIPAIYLRELITIPPQALKCHLADLKADGDVWPPEAILWLREKVLNKSLGSMKIVKLDEARAVHVYLFSGNGSQDPQSSVNHQLASCPFWNPKVSSVNRPFTPFLPDIGDDLCSMLKLNDLGLPPQLELPKKGQNMDVFVSVASHPGHFVVQPWKDLYKLEVLMGEMVLYYNKQEVKTIHIKKNSIYAAKIDDNWHRVLVKSILSNGLVSVYQLDYGKFELVSYSHFQTLIDAFRQLPFQGTSAQLAGVTQRLWNEEASMLFRNHVEKKALVAHIESVEEGDWPWERKLSVYLVDTSQKDCDVWVHTLMEQFLKETSDSA